MFSNPSQALYHTSISGFTEPFRLPTVFYTASVIKKFEFKKSVNNAVDKNKLRVLKINFHLPNSILSLQRTTNRTEINLQLEILD